MRQHSKKMGKPGIESIWLLLSWWGMMGGWIIFGFVPVTSLDSSGRLGGGPGGVVGCVRSGKQSAPNPSLLLLGNLRNNNNNNNNDSSNKTNRGWGKDGGGFTSYGIEYDCQVRTLGIPGSGNGANESLNIRSEDWTRTSAIRVQCNDALFFESFLVGNQTLLKLTNLRKMEIRSCKLRRIPAGIWSELKFLKSLSIQSRNGQWSSSVSLDVEPGCFNNSLEGLEILDLSENNVWTLPERVFCPLQSLVTLNISRNKLTELEELNSNEEGDRTRNKSRGESAGEPDAICVLPRLEHVDLSFNALRQVLQIGKSWASLQKLQLQNNLIEQLEDSAFSELTRLKSVNLSSNRLVALPPTIFKFNVNLREIYLANNSISALAPAVFSRLPQLLMLDLSRNTLTSQWIREDMFHGLEKLRVLKLSFNQLSLLDAHIFKDLISLVALSLDSNRIETINPEAFRNMDKLVSLDLSNNKLTNIPAQLLNNLANLKQLYLDHNKIRSVDDDALNNSTSLQDLGLAGNLLQEVPVALRSGLSLLRSLDLGENRIFVVSNESFRGLSQLYGLRMVDNRLSELPPGFCDPLRKLRVLNLAQNRLYKISSSALISCPELRALRLDSNSLEELPVSLTPQLPSLLWLNVSENRLTTADYRQLPPSIEWLDLSHNSLESFSGSESSSRSSSSSARPWNIRVLDLSYNKLTQLKMTMIPRSVETIRVNHNKLRNVAPDTFLRLSRLRRVELVNNELESLPLTSLKLSSPGTSTLPGSRRPLPGSLTIAEFYLGGNPFNCDCSMEWLLRLHQHYSGAHSTFHNSNYRAGNSLPFGQYPRIVDLDGISCKVSARSSSGGTASGSGGSGQGVNGTVVAVVKPLGDTREEDFLCEYKTHCDKNCHCCDFDACDCAMVCPVGCVCYHDGGWTKNVVACSGEGGSGVSESGESSSLSEMRGVKDISRLPMTATEIYLDGNNIPVLTSHVFIGKRNLRKLHLNDSRVESISNKTFNGLISLEILRLEENLLAGIEGYEFGDLVNLLELYLQNNLLRFIAPDTFTPLKLLSVLRLDGNLLVTLHMTQLNSASRMGTLLLSGNPWSCECEFVIPFRSWLSDRESTGTGGTAQPILTDLNFIKCQQHTLEQMSEGGGNVQASSASASSTTTAPSTIPDSTTGSSSLIIDICPLTASNERLRFPSSVDNLMFPPHLLPNLLPEGAESSSGGLRGHHSVGGGGGGFKAMGAGKLGGGKRNFLPSPLEVLPDNSGSGLLWTLIVTSAGLLMLILAVVLIFRKEIYYRVNDRLNLFGSAASCWLGGDDGEAWGCNCDSEDCQHKKCFAGGRGGGGRRGGRCNNGGGMVNGIRNSSRGDAVGGSSSFGDFFWGPDDSEKLFDAYFLYSARDEETLVEKIVGELEHGSGEDGSGSGGSSWEQNFYRLCLHYRDLCLTPGNPLNCEMVLGACDSSKRIVLLLSRTFLANEWTNMDFRATITQAISRHHKRFIVILLPCLNEGGWTCFSGSLFASTAGKNGSKELPILNNKPLSQGINPNMINVMKSSVIHFQDANFWPKLKVLFPPPSISSMMMTARRGFTCHTNRRQQRYYQPRTVLANGNNGNRNLVSSSSMTNLQQGGHKSAFPENPLRTNTAQAANNNNPTFSASPDNDDGGDGPPPLPPPRNNSNQLPTTIGGQFPGQANSTSSAQTIQGHVHLISHSKKAKVSKPNPAIPKHHLPAKHLIGKENLGMDILPSTRKEEDETQEEGQDDDDHLYSSLSECPTLPCRGNKNQKPGIISTHHEEEEERKNQMLKMSCSSAEDNPNSGAFPRNPSQSFANPVSSPSRGNLPGHSIVPNLPHAHHAHCPNLVHPNVHHNHTSTASNFPPSPAPRTCHLHQNLEAAPGLNSPSHQQHHHHHHHPACQKSSDNPLSPPCSVSPEANRENELNTQQAGAEMMRIQASLLNEYSNQEAFRSRSLASATLEQAGGIHNSPRTQLREGSTVGGSGNLASETKSRSERQNPKDAGSNNSRSSSNSSSTSSTNRSMNCGNGPRSDDGEINGVTENEIVPGADESANSRGQLHQEQTDNSGGVNTNKQPMYFV